MDALVQAGTPFLDRTHVNLQERARAIIDRRPDLEHLFDAWRSDRGAPARRKAFVLAFV